MSHPEIKGMHELLIHDYGPAHADVSLHVEMSSQLDMVTAHEDYYRSIEDELKSQCHCDVTIHIDRSWRKNRGTVNPSMKVRQATYLHRLSF